MENTFPDAHFDPETLALLVAVFNEAWAEMVEEGYVANPGYARHWAASRIMVAAARGERDPARLKAIALGMVDLPLRA
jgi:hypothetical protein